MFEVGMCYLIYAIRVVQKLGLCKRNSFTKNARLIGKCVIKYCNCTKQFIYLRAGLDRKQSVNLSALLIFGMPRINKK